MRLYAPAFLLFIAAIWLAAFGDGMAFGIVVLLFLGVAIVIQVCEQRRQLSRRRGRSHGP